ncbi:putative translation initiation factor 1 (eIF-1/SUI1) protein [Pseudoloma neurophilia]|uniref:Putative translation initiation factor 1 (EIF-1/SUI1) protein n=1 Tax=Pseudoloma neurophilia TaxID=146866 RepID=A0A0R0M0E7_9MICR|nr:putative translation initiation factor 1 (eIF-1/SUI1) protein [Pseudoloma neurophilia]
MKADIDKPVVHVRIQQIYGKKKVTTITGIEEYRKFLMEKNDTHKSSDDEETKETEKIKESEKPEETKKTEETKKPEESKDNPVIENFPSLDILLSKLKKRFNCGGHIVKKENVITLQGEHSYDIREVLIKLIGKDITIVVHGMK